MSGNVYHFFEWDMRHVSFKVLCKSRNESSGAFESVCPAYSNELLQEVMLVCGLIMC